MPVPNAFADQRRPENQSVPEKKFAVVALSALQLAFVVLLWLLALLPLAVMALGAMVFRAVKPAGSKFPTSPVAGS